MCRLWVVKGVRGNNTGHDESRIFPSSQQIKKQPSVLSSNRGVEDVDLGISGSPSVSICANPETRGVSGTHGYSGNPPVARQAVPRHENQGTCVQHLAVVGGVEIRLN